MARKYTQKKRAEKQEETRARIAEAALDLHRLLGPNQTSISMVADKAGVQRHTLYAHFPDERSLLMACSGLHLKEDPPPDANAWEEITDRAERTRIALADIYSWYERNESLIGGVLRDAEQNEVLREITHERLGPYFAAWRVALRPEDDTAESGALLGLALSFHCWRTLAVGERLGAGAAPLMAGLLCADRGDAGRAALPRERDTG